MTNTEFIMALRRELRLESWFIRTEGLPEGQWDSDAYTTVDRENMVATIHLTPSTSREHIAHEMVHVLLSDLAYVASEGASVDRMNFYHMLEERVCNIVGHVLWNMVDDAEG